MTTDRIVDLLRLTPHRVLCLALAAPAVWIIWMVVDRNPAKATILVLALLWVAVLARTWSWYSKATRTAGA